MRRRAFMILPRFRVCAALASMSVLSGCLADIVGDSTPGQAPGLGLGGSQAVGGASAAGGQGPNGRGPMGASVLHRLNHLELANSVRQLFGEAATGALPDGVDPLVQGFDTNAEALTISESGVDSLMRMAGEIAAGVELSDLAPCNGLIGRACVEQRVPVIARRVLRRPASAEELASYLALWDEVQLRTDEDTATRAVLQRLLMTPDFLYHVGWGDQLGRLDAYELAARLAFFAWESTPDDALLDEAAKGTLATTSGVEMLLDRLLADERGRAMLLRFFEQWAELPKLRAVVKDPMVYPDFEVLKAPMVDEFRAFIGDLVSQHGTVKELFTSPTTFVTGELSSVYGVSSTGQGPQSVLLPATQRAGILTQTAFLAGHAKANKSAPVLRGRFIREQVLCASVPPPPPGANTVPANATVPTTTREYYAQLTSGSTCSGCHDQLNPVGFAFEGFDGMGRARTEENGHPVDTSGAITAGDVAGPVAGAVQLATLLGESQTVRNCLAKQLFRSRFRRSEVGGDEALIEAVAAALAVDGDRLTSLARVLGRQEAMKHRHFRIGSAGEGLP